MIQRITKEIRSGNTDRALQLFSIVNRHSTDSERDRTFSAESSVPELNACQ